MTRLTRKEGGAHRRPRRTGRLRPPAAVVAIVLGMGLVTGGAQTAGATVGVPVTYTDFAYDTTWHRPTENKPQSKLWHADGSWWALLVSQADDKVHIFELQPDHRWRDTGVKVDDRVDSTGDAHWDAADGTLTVASRADGSSMRVMRFQYSSSSRTWNALSGFPVTVNTGGGSESATIDRDSTGRYWATYTRSQRVWVAHSDPDGRNWTAGFLPSVPDVTIKSDDISALIAFRGQIGVMWSDQQSSAFRMAIHTDGAPDNQWRVENALAGANLADDHVNLKGMVDDAQGRIYAAIKTSQDNVGPSATLVGVLVRTPRPDGTGDWALVPAGTVADDHTRPIVMIDQTNQELYFFATAPVSGGDIYYKKTSLANPSFPPGRGQKFIDHQYVVNNVSGSKQPVTSGTGMVLVAVAEGRKLYVHAEMELAGGGSPPPADESPPSTPTGLTATQAPGQVTLTWNASTDDSGVAGYEVRRDGALLGSPAGTSFTDTTVQPGASYSYTVTALDTAGNRSDPSEPLLVSVAGDPPPAGSDITLRSTSTGANNAEATITVPRPVTQSGDLMVATIDYRGQSAITAPDGWQLVRADANGTAMRKATYYRVATAAEPSSYTWRFGAQPAAVGSLLVYAGVSGTAPVEASGGQVNDKSTAITAPSVSTPSSGAVVVGLFGVARAATITPPSGTVERTEVTSPTGLTYPMTGSTADEVPATTGPTGTLVAQSTVAGPNIGQTLVLRPAS